MIDEQPSPANRIAPVDEVRLLRALACDWRLSRGDVAVGAVLLAHANSAWRSFPGTALIAKQARLSLTNTKASLKRLERLDYIFVERPGLRKANRYQMASPPAVPASDPHFPSPASFQGRTGDASIPSADAIAKNSGDAGEPSCDDRAAATRDAQEVATRDAGIFQLGMPTRREYAFNTPLNAQKHDQPAQSPADRFGEFWAIYPRKDAKAKAAAVWRSKKLDQVADRLIADVAARVADPVQWSDSKFIPHASTFLNGKRWEDQWPRSQHTATVTTLPREPNHEAINAASMRRLGIAP